MNQEKKEKIHEIQERAGNFITIVFFIILVIFLIKLINWDFSGTSITAYPVQCKEKVDYGKCKDPEFTLNKDTYTVLANRQEVLTNNGITERLSKCAVIDKKNWHCSYDDSSADFGFTNGKYFHITNYDVIGKETRSLFKELDDKTYYVSRLQWIKIWCKPESGPLQAICFPLWVILD
jgi:hypothetical protein